VVVIGRVGVGDLDHADGLIDPRAVDVFAQQVVIAVVFGDHVGAVGFDRLTTGIDVAGAVAIDLLFNAPAGYIVLVGDLLPIHLATDLVLKGAVEIELEVIAILLGGDLPVELDGFSVLRLDDGLQAEMLT